MSGADKVSGHLGRTVRGAGRRTLSFLRVSVSACPPGAREKKEETRVVGGRDRGRGVAAHQVELLHALAEPSQPARDAPETADALGIVGMKS